jgi:hypothetical protein
MAGGLLNLIATSSANVFLQGNPSKTFFKATYAKITNFGLQKFRLDYDGQRDLRPSEDSTFSFRIKRYADLLMDTYIAVTLPNIWSPLYHPCANTNYQWVPYEFRWIDHLGTAMIRSIEITCGNALLQKYSGEYLHAMVERDFSSEKKELFRRMSGHVHELNAPHQAYGRQNTYPSAYTTSAAAGAEPSIRARTIYVPINAWFTLNSRLAFPLVALQYNELVIKVTLRPIQELFRVRDVFDFANFHPYVQPDFTQEQFQMYRFLQTPPAVRIGADAFENTTRTWNADVHLIATYCFLSKEETELFAAEDQVYLVKDVFQYGFENVTGTSRVPLTSSGMVANWMFFLQRNDVNMRNEWTNYTNWAYAFLPVDVSYPPTDVDAAINAGVDTDLVLTHGPAYQPSGANTGLFVTGDFAPINHRDILQSLAIVFDGTYRENTLSRGVFDYVEKYARTAGCAAEGIYCYNYCLNTDPLEYQPSGAINLSRFRSVELELSTFVPQMDASGASFGVVCDTTGSPVGVVNSPSWRLYQYNYNLTVFEERYNILSFVGGNCGMMHAR